ncbi:class I SAM-dependent methyltransferase [Tomitella gaofuii]|uniref:class I SAM-dependent methyltransferase n=1 Tax=Tomitella gaofuii TaxID=2760083 RepID=UPI0015FA8334|nr:class I SAM-dependent methyltransferase [Tomitella gaofuii]
MNWFSDGGAEYARSRPDYPPEVVRYLAEVASPESGRVRWAVDVGCGTGQFTEQLAAVHPAVIGVDPSVDQLANAVAHRTGGRIEYACGAAERLPIADGAACLITAAQSAHWFDLPRFWDEVRRVAAPGAVVALATYGKLAVGRPDDDAQRDGAVGRTDIADELTKSDRDRGTDSAGARFQRFYGEEIAEFWPPERAMVENGYADVAFPFDECTTPAATIRRSWSLDDLLGYVGTWSATRNLHEQGRSDLIDRFVADITELWGSREIRRPVEWPVSMRVGRVV